MFQLKTFAALFCILFIHITSFAQDKVLVFHKTNGFRHSSIDDGISMIESQGAENGLWDVDDSNDASVFTTDNLSNYKVVIWCNTSGNGLLNARQQAAFEDYIRNGGGFVGIHAATDTYRDRSWSFYNDLVGGIVQSRPNHTNSRHRATMTVNERTHQSVSHLGDSWEKVEEYYYWRNNGGQLYSGNNNLLTVESTGNNDYDEPRPISWYKEYEGGRSFYTALGHNDSDYSDDSDFMTHVEEGIKWAGNFDDTELSGPEQLVENGTYYIASPDIDQNLYSNETIGHNATMGDASTNEASQKWIFSHEGNNVYTIQNEETNRFLETSNAICRNSANVATSTSANDSHQKWEVSKNEIYYVLKPTHCTSRALDRTSPDADAEVILFSFNLRNKDENWLINEVDSTVDPKEPEQEIPGESVRLEAEDYDAMLGVRAEQSSEATDNIGYINNGDFLRFDNVNMTSIESINARVASRFVGGNIEVRLGSTTGTLVGSVQISNTGGNQVYETVSSTIENIVGVHDVYLVFTGGNGFLFNLNWIEFNTSTPASEAIINFSRLEAEDYDEMSGVQTEQSSEVTDNVGYINNTDWIKFNNVNLTGAQSIDARVASRYSGGDIEVRLGSVTGPSLGTITISNTGGNQVYETVSANLSSVSGVHDLYLVFTGGRGFLFNLNWVQFSSISRSSKDIQGANGPQITVYPNPVIDNITIENAAGTSLKVFDNNGSLILSSNILGNKETLNTESLSQGIYYFRISNNEKLRVIKVIK